MRRGEIKCKKPLAGAKSSATQFSPIPSNLLKPAALNSCWPGTQPVGSALVAQLQPTPAWQSTGRPWRSARLGVGVRKLVTLSPGGLLGSDPPAHLARSGCCSACNRHWLGECGLLASSYSSNPPVSRSKATTSTRRHPTVSDVTGNGFGTLLWSQPCANRPVWAGRAWTEAALKEFRRGNRMPCSGRCLAVQQLGPDQRAVLSGCSGPTLKPEE